jgi:hypothetical protein
MSLPFKASKDLKHRLSTYPQSRIIDAISKVLNVTRSKPDTLPIESMKLPQEADGVMYPQLDTEALSESAAAPFTRHTFTTFIVFDREPERKSAGDCENLLNIDRDFGREVQGFTIFVVTF